MRLGLVSDTHDALAPSLVAARFFQERRCDLVLHLGDVMTGVTVDAFAGLPMRFLRGNNDEEASLASSIAKHGFPPLSDAWVETVAGVRVAAHHGHAAPWLGNAEPAVLLHGHTHRFRCERVGRTLVVNPGALHRARVRTIALMDLPSLEVHFFEVGPDHVAPMRERRSSS